MLTPFYRLLCCRSWGPSQVRVILAASGSSVYCFNFADGSVISRWSPLTSSSAVAQENDSTIEPPAKRRRLSSAAEDENTPERSPDIITINDAAEKPRRRKPKLTPLSSVVKLAITKDGQHVIAVTGDDKTVRVLEMCDGNLTQISARQMPKKPNAMVLLPDDSMILIADKFGDVYALPLLVPAGMSHSAMPAQVAQGTDSQEGRPRKPAADVTTVHTRKNLLALENQLKSKQVAPPKKTFDFEHTLLLGHVSLLTDMAYVCIEDLGKTRSYLLTSDRDEHIRVSRGIPQTYTIESFCLGHASFVNRLLVIPHLPHLLVSGGGDDCIFVWDWQKSEILLRADLSECVNDPDIRKKFGLPTESTRSPVAVIGLWSHELTKSSSSELNSTCVLAFVEALLGNPLDLTIDHETSSVLVAVDPIHRVGSTADLRLPQDNTVADPATHVLSRPYLQMFQFDESDQLREVIDSQESCDNDNGGLLTWNLNRWSHSCQAEVDECLLSDLFYGVEHMRKKGMTGDEGPDGEDEEG